MLTFRRVNLKESGNMENKEREESSEPVLRWWGSIQLANYFEQHRAFVSAHLTSELCYQGALSVTFGIFLFPPPHLPPPSRPLLQLMYLFLRA